MPSRLFVGNLSYQTTEEELRDLFQQAGSVQSVRVITDPATGRPRGFAFVEMASKEEAEQAIDQLNGRVFRDRNLVINEARAQAERGGDRGAGGAWGRGWPAGGRPAGGRPGGGRPGGGRPSGGRPGGRRSSRP